MHPRHPLVALLDQVPPAIEAGNLNNIQWMIESAYRHPQYGLEPETSLSRIDESGMSFLAMALADHREKIALLFLNLQEKNSELICRVDVKGRSLIWHAAAEGFTDVRITDKQPYTGILPRLIELAKNDSDSKLWLLADNEGLDTPLHMAVRRYNHLPSVTYLIEVYQHEIDQLNRNRQSALHLALNQPVNQVVAVLINAGASLTIFDLQLQSPFTLFIKLTGEKQQQIFRLLKPEYRHNILDLYSEWLTHAAEIDKEADLTNLKNIYYSLASLTNMFYLMKAKFEQGAVPLCPEFAVYPEILNLVPLYRDRLAAEYPELTEETLVGITNARVTKPNNQLYFELYETTECLDRLTRDIDVFLNTLRPPSYRRTFQYHFIYQLLLLLGLMTSTIMSGIIAFDNENHPLAFYKPSNGLKMGMCALFIFSFVATVIDFIAFTLCFIGDIRNRAHIGTSPCFPIAYHEVDSSHEARSQLSAQINADVIEPLNKLEETNLTDQPSSTQAMLRALSANVKELMGDLKRDDVVRSLGSVKGEIAKVRANAILSSQPLPKVVKHSDDVVIELGDVDEGENGVEMEDLSLNNRYRRLSVV